MNIFINNYNLGYQVFVVSFSDDITTRLLDTGKKVGQIFQDKILLLPQNAAIEINDSQYKELKTLSNYDVVEISSSGITYTWYTDTNPECFIPLTNRCNSNCIMCPASIGERTKDTELTIEHILEIISCLPTDLSHLTITGGEPTLVGLENFIRIYEHITNHLPYTKLLLLTNGRTFGDRHFWDEFVKYNTSNLRIAIPIHADSDILHDYITQAEGSLIQTLRGLTNVMNSGIEFEIRIVISKLNCNNITSIAKLIVELFPSVDVVHFIGLEMRGNCVLNSELVIISYQDAFSCCKDAINLLLMNGINVELYNFPHCMIDTKYWPLTRQSISESKKSFLPECELCQYKNICSGLFISTKNYYKPVVFPIKEITND